LSTRCSSPVNDSFLIRPSEVRRLRGGRRATLWILRLVGQKWGWSTAARRRLTRSPTCRWPTTGLPGFSTFGIPTRPLAVSGCGPVRRVDRYPGPSPEQRLRVRIRGPVVRAGEPGARHVVVRDLLQARRLAAVDHVEPAHVPVVGRRQAAGRRRTVRSASLASARRGAALRARLAVSIGLGPHSRAVGSPRRASPLRSARTYIDSRAAAEVG
jgi:hypothetical protein